MFDRKYSLALGGALALALSASVVPTASAAMPFSAQSNTPTFQNNSDMLIQVESRRQANLRERGFGSYNKSRHGDYCQFRRAGCNNYYRGRYYERQWWLAPAIIGGAIIGSQLNGNYGRDYGDDHVSWCEDRYRSYNPRDNTWVSYSGEIRQCNSPYL